MVGKTLDVFAKPLGVPSLDGVDNFSVERLPSLLDEARVGDLVREGMLERELDVWEQLRLVHELGGLEPRESVSKAAVVEVGDRLEEGERHVLADHGGGLEQALVVGRQPIDTRGEDGPDGCRNLDRVQLLYEPVSAARTG